ncbi:MAG: 16S rRNA (guanine(527)-N(7))-methyltransferase RsmG [Methylococcaceae bacterium]|nr:16S rRNA (guanine(527)-N(7))-methyltransferase RsmG [Methylococcaceae bacterium]MCI0734622.1 16S rRNA (guanine(527)-N(7))-methyltransferase RsmG [Methylococcaceae bacterium]
MERGLSGQLAEGLKQSGIACNPELLSGLLDFLALLSKWNKTYNLTAIRDPLTMISHHLLDSLSLSPYIRGQRVLDIGTGPGLPGIPLSILHSDKSFVLIDSNGKKTRFVRQAVLELGLMNVEVVQDRVERFKNELLFDTIVTRAFAAMSEILSSSSHLLKDGGRILAMRGRLPDRETNYPGFRASVIPIRVPGVHAERHILMLTPQAHEP